MVRRTERCLLFPLHCGFMAGLALVATGGGALWRASSNEAVQRSENFAHQGLPIADSRLQARSSPTMTKSQIRSML